MNLEIIITLLIFGNYLKIPAQASQALLAPGNDIDYLDNIPNGGFLIQDYNPETIKKSLFILFHENLVLYANRHHSVL